MSSETKTPAGPATDLPPPSTLPAGGIVLHGRKVAYASRFVLAPMEGVTHRTFRDLVIGLGGVGAAWTEFIRVSNNVLRALVIAKELGPPRLDPPVGVQLMGSDPTLVAATAVNAVAAGAPMIDLNFGCPAPVVFKKCAGSALLDHPVRMTALIRAAVEAVAVPVTAKIRLGTTDTSRLRDIVDAVEQGGAAALTVHARTRADAYTHAARWEFLTQVRRWTRLPMIGNGDVLTADDAHRMLRECGVDGVMIGRGAIRDPWIFARLAARARGEPEPVVTADDLARFHAAYRDGMFREGATDLGTLGQMKQLYRRLAVGIPIDDESRVGLLRAPTLAVFEERVAAIARRA